MYGLFALDAFFHDCCCAMCCAPPYRYVKGKMVTQSYMDGYPFPYYVIIRDVRSLPEALADALRQWFEAMSVAKL